MKICYKCKKSVEKFVTFGSSYKYKKYEYYRCYPCNRNVYQIWMKKDSSREKRKIQQVNYRKKWVKEDYVKENARYKLNYSIKKGLTKKPKNCEICNEERKLDGHHEDYSKPLKVMWLCRLCHTQKDKNRRKYLMQ